MLENIKVKNRKYIKMDAFTIVLYALVTIYCLSMLYVFYQLAERRDRLRVEQPVRIPELRVRLEIQQLRQGFQGL